MAKPPLNGVAETEYTKSHLRGFSILLKISFRVHELVAGSNAWRVCAVKRQCKSRQFCYPQQSHTTTRANIAHEIAEQIRARKSARPLKVSGGD